MEGLIVKAVSSFYYVFSGNAEYECKARGAFRKSGVSPVVGDRVTFTPRESGKGVIENVLPRKNLLKRPLAANIDKLFIVSAPKTPAPDTLMIDRLCAIAVNCGIKPVPVFNKSDLGDMSAFADIYRSAGFSVYVVSAAEKRDTDLLKAETENCLCVFAGNSGVGKSSLLNAMFDENAAQTGEVSEKLGRGRHTTRHTVLYRYGSSLIADTPGFAAVEFDGHGEMRGRLAECFPDFADYTDKCRFTGCSHTCEPGCAVIAAVEAGEISASRHKSYVTLYEEIKREKKW